MSVMKKVIGILNSSNENYFDTCLRINDEEKKTWEWDNMNFYGDLIENRSLISSQWLVKRAQKNHYSVNYFALNVSYNTLNIEWLKSYIWVFESILQLENTEDLTEFPVEWLTNDAEFRIRARKKSSKEIELEIKCKNKYRLTYDEFYMWAFWWGVPEEYWRDVVSDYNGKPNEYSKLWSSNYPVKNIEIYISELIEEYEKHTEEKYVRK